MSEPAAPPLMFDAPLHRRWLARAHGAGAADFLLRRAALELEDRLSAVKRDFHLRVDFGTPGPDAAQVLAARPGGSWAQLAPLPAALWRGGAVAGLEAAPLAPAGVDLIVSLLALHQVNDLPGALVQARQALRPDGLFLACLPGGRTLAELRHSLAAAEAEISGGASPRVIPFADLRDLGGLMQRAGFALPVVDSDPVTVRYSDIFGLMRDLRAMGAANALIARSRTFLRRDVLFRAAAIYAERFADADGRIRATFELMWLSGWAPHESQRPPLKPGSARMRLADALGVKQGDG